MITKLNTNYSIKIDSSGAATILFKEEFHSFLGTIEKVVSVSELSENVIGFTFLNTNGVQLKCVCVPGYNSGGGFKGAYVEGDIKNGIEYYNIEGKHIIYNPSINKSWRLEQMPKIRDKDKIIKIASAIKEFYEG